MSRQHLQERLKEAREKRKDAVSHIQVSIGMVGVSSGVAYETHGHVSDGAVLVGVWWGGRALEKLLEVRSQANKATGLEQMLVEEEIKQQTATQDPSAI